MGPRQGGPQPGDEGPPAWRCDPSLRGRLGDEGLQLGDGTPAWRWASGLEMGPGLGGPVLEVGASRLEMGPWLGGPGLEVGSPAWDEVPGLEVGPLA